MQLKRVGWIGLFSIVLSGAAWAQDHADISPAVRDGRIVTHAYEDGTSTLFSDTRVFGYDFGESPLNPYFIGDPGINGRPLSDLPAGDVALTPNTQLGFNLRVVGQDAGHNVGTNTLLYWDGSDVDNVVFGDVPGTDPGESLRINFGSDRTAGRNTGDISGFPFAVAAGNGTVHVHLNSYLNSVLGEAIDDAVNAPIGLYLIELELTNSGSGAALSSLPFWIVYNNGLDEEIHDAAIEWVEANLIPEPASLALWGVGTALVLRGRFRGRLRRRASRPIIAA